MVFAEYLLTDNTVHYKGNSSMLENFCFIINQLYLIFFFDTLKQTFAFYLFILIGG